MSEPDPYFLGYRQAEQERLERQAHELAHDSEWLFEQIGVQPGWRVVEIGCGPQGCLGLLAQRVGTTGQVLGVERSPEQVERARQFIADSHWTNVEVLHADARQTGLPEQSFDLATARLVLVNVPEPEFLVREVLPLVNGNYRTLTGHANTGLGGSSYGGVATLYALMARPNEFGYGLIESPSLQIGMGQLVRDTDPFVARPVKVFIGFGGREFGNDTGNDLMIGLCRRVDRNLRNQGYDDTHLRFVVTPDAQHNEDAWALRLPEALAFLFGDWKATQQ